MVEETLTCPTCGSSTLEIGESDKVLCASCGATFMLGRSPEDLHRCPRCGFRNEPRAHACDECGADLVKFCARCGAELDLHLRFCDQCGANYEGASSPDGRCQWCSFENETAAKLCDKCGASLIITCPSCEGETKAGVDFCRACGLDYATLLEPEEDEP
jgi:hypothetical protein